MLLFQKASLEECLVDRESDEFQQVSSVRRVLHVESTKSDVLCQLLWLNDTRQKLKILAAAYIILISFFISLGKKSWRL